MSSATGGINQNFSSRVSANANINNQFNFDGPQFYNNPLTYTNNAYNNVMQTFLMDNVLQLSLSNNVTLGAGSTFACSDLSGCGGTGSLYSITLLTGVSLLAGGLTFTRKTLNFNAYGMLVGDTATADTVVTTTDCSA